MATATPAVADAPDKGADSTAQILKSVEDLSKQVNSVVNLKGDVEDIKKALAQKEEVKEWATPRLYGRLKAFGDDYQKAYECGAALIASMHYNNPSYRTPFTGQMVKWCEDRNIIQKAGQQLEGTNTLGGNLVWGELSNRIILLRETYGIARQHAYIEPMMSDTKTINRRTGGLTVTFGAEAAALGATQMTWDQVQLVAKKAGGLARFSTELNEDAVVSVADKLADEFAYAFAVKEDQCLFIGDGTSTYGGMQGFVTKFQGSSLAGNVVAATGHNLPSEIDLPDCEAVMGTLPQYAYQRGRAAWYTSRFMFARVFQRLMWAGGGNTAGSLAQGTAEQFLGYPVYITQTMAGSESAGTTSNTVALFGDLELACTMGVRRDVTISTSLEKYFDTDEVAMRGTERFDCVVHDVGTTAVVGPIVALETAS